MIVFVVSILGTGISIITSQVDGQQKFDEFRTMVEDRVCTEFVDEKFAERVHSESEVIFKDDLFLVDVEVRAVDNGRWWRTVTTDIGSTVEFYVRYENTTQVLAQDVMVSVSLPPNMEYVNDSAILYNESYPKGLAYHNTCEDAVNIGNYGQYGNAELRFKAIVTDTDLADGWNRLFSYAKISANGEVLIQHARVYVYK